MAFATATATAALVALVVNMRKQGLAEQVAAGEITAAFTVRFRAAAQQLGGESPAERLAGVYAMAGLADEYPSRRQQCVDVLCGYLRLPFDPATDHLAARSTTSTRTGRTGRTVSTTETPASRPFDQQVRETIFTVIAAHTRPVEGVGAGPWSNLDYDFTGAHLTNVDLAHCVFKRRITFGGATFSGESTWFDKATFSGGSAWFVEARFSGESTSFHEARFSGERTSFARATFSGKRTSFDGARFFGERTSFARATFSGRISFGRATFSEGITTFDDCVFKDGAVVSGLEDPILVKDARVTRGGEPFRGWPILGTGVQERGGLEAGRLGDGA